MKTELIKNERMLLRELGFMVYVELPHKYIPNYAKVLGLTDDVSQKAWSFTNDWYVTRIWWWWWWCHFFLLLIVLTALGRTCVCAINPVKLRQQLSSWQQGT